VSNVAPAGDRFSVRVPKTAELVASHIRRRIVLGELHQGDALPPEGALMEEFTISRPTLREAFRILESEGLITVRRGARGGARVQEPSADVAARYAGLVLQHRDTTVADVLDARVIVEAPAARMLAERRNRASIANRLQELLDAVDPAEAGRFHEFNALMVELTGNQTLILLTAMLEHISRAAALSYTRRAHRDDDVRLARKAHRTRQKLIDLIRAGDADGAEELWRAHLTEAGRVLAAGSGETLVDLFD
jgi:DNA-binding FadR family transcriptional regulator